MGPRSSTAPERLVDLRSDTVTRPTPDMRRAMAEAEVGDDVYGEDPTLTRLEATVADLLGHEAGLFTPSGSLANQLGVRLHVRPGQELLADSTAHVLRAELGAAATFSGVTTRSWAAPRGLLDASVPLAMMTPDAGPYLVSTAAVAVENTHNFGGGTIQPLDQIEALRAGTQAAGVTMHLDGARLWNAHVATGVPLSTYGGLFDTVSVCLSKGLGAPVGSVLVSSRERIAEARVWRKRYGAGMRQAGILAAAGLFALEHNVERLAEDHEHAHLLAVACHEVAPSLVDPYHAPTNIVALDLTGHPLDAPALAAAAGEHGVRVSVLGPRTARLVTHLDVDTDGIKYAADVLRRVLAV
ncbi:MAG: threonine aldolase family protein [Actinomycetales bacterium]